MYRSLFIQLLLVVATLAVYWQVTDHDFVDFDDPEYVRNPLSVRDPALVKENQFVVNGLTVQGVQWAFTTNYAANWHPLTWLSLMLDAEIYPGNGRNPGGYHFTNLILHIVNVLLLFGFLKSVTGAVWRSAFVAALLAVHPLHVESVAWISERKDVLSMMFWLLTMWAYVRYVRQRNLGWYVATAGLLALGLMAKPMLVTLPFVLLLLDFWPLGRMKIWASLPALSTAQAEPGINGVAGSIRRGDKLVSLIVEKLPLLAISLASSWITMQVQVGSHKLEDGVWMSLPVRMGNAVVSYVRYIGKLFWPENLAVLYPNPSYIGREFWSAMQVGSAAAVLAIITIFVIARSRQTRGANRSQPYFLVGWLWFLGTLLPVIGIVQIGRHSMADRYAYVPMIGLYIAIAWGIADVVVRSRWGGALLRVGGVLVIIACAIVAHRQTSHWNNSQQLFQHALAVTNENWLIHNNYAAILDRAGRRDEAIAQMHLALKIFPECDWLHNHLGGILSRDGQLYEAQCEFEEALRLNPQYALAHRNLAAVLRDRGMIDEAISHLREALRIDPTVANDHQNPR